MVAKSEDLYGDQWLAQPRMAADLQKLIHMGKILDDKTAVKACDLLRVFYVAICNSRSYEKDEFSSTNRRKPAFLTGVLQQQVRSMNSIQ